MYIFKVFLMSIIIASCGVSVNSFLVDFFEEGFIALKFSDCTFAKNLFGYSYEKATAQAILRMPNVFFNLQLVNGSTEKHALITSPVSLHSSPNFNKFLKTVIIIHGYFGDSTFPNPVKLASELKKIGNMNVLTLDHGAMTKDNYYLASTNARYIGDALGSALTQMHALGNRDFHLIGHSIGAHIAGFAGKEFSKSKLNMIQRITGLDPAGPCYFNEPDNLRLSKTDATFVDVIHTDIRALGITKPIGHVDFYPNSGGNIAGCLVFCGHVRAFEYYIESVSNRNGFLSIKCPSWDSFLKKTCPMTPQVSMGYWLQNGNAPEGLYYLKTADNSPYALGVGGLQ